MESTRLRTEHVINTRPCRQFYTKKKPFRIVKSKQYAGDRGVYSAYFEIIRIAAHDGLTFNFCTVHGTRWVQSAISNIKIIGKKSNTGASNIVHQPKKSYEEVGTPDGYALIFFTQKYFFYSTPCN